MHHVRIPQVIKGIVVYLEGAAVTNHVAETNQDDKDSEYSSESVYYRKLFVVVMEIDAHGTIFTHGEAFYTDITNSFFLTMLAITHTLFTFGIEHRFSFTGRLEVLTLLFSVIPFHAKFTIGIHLCTLGAGLIASVALFRVGFKIKSFETFNALILIFKAAL